MWKSVSLFAAFWRNTMGKFLALMQPICSLVFHTIKKTPDLPLFHEFAFIWVTGFIGVLNLCFNLHPLFTICNHSAKMKAISDFEGSKWSSSTNLPYIAIFFKSLLLLDPPQIYQESDLCGRKARSRRVIKGVHKEDTRTKHDWRECHSSDSDRTRKKLYKGYSSRILRGWAFGNSSYDLLGVCFRIPRHNKDVEKHNKCYCLWNNPYTSLLWSRGSDP